MSTKDGSATRSWKAGSQAKFVPTWWRYRASMEHLRKEVVGHVMLGFCTVKGCTKTTSYKYGGSTGVLIIHMHD